MCPYVNPVQEIPDDGIADFLDSPRFSTGYAALHHCIGFMPETHMLKPFAARYHTAPRALLDSALAYTVQHGEAIRAARAADRAAIAAGAPVALDWQLDRSQPRALRFSGFAAVREPSRLGRYQRLRYDRNAPFEKDIPVLRPLPGHGQRAAAARLPAAAGLARRRPAPAGTWREDAARSVCTAQLPAEAYRVVHHKKAGASPLKADTLHDAVQVGDPSRGGRRCRRRLAAAAGAGRTTALSSRCWSRWPWTASSAGPSSTACWTARKASATTCSKTRPNGCWPSEPGLRERFAAWQAAHPELQDDAESVLGFIYEASQRYAEPAWRRYPVLRLLAWPEGA